jgi:hypothetical protein
LTWKKAFCGQLNILNSSNFRGMASAFTIARVRKQIREIINILNLDLSGLTVLTEAGSNLFIFTPFIAYLAGASKVFVWLKDTPYGNAADIEQEFYAIVKALELDTNRFSLAVNQRPVEHIQQADIITNLGSVRPLNQVLLSEAKSGAVVSYMCEAWEIRPEDVDIAYCKQKGVKIAGVWENHSDLLIFKGCGPLSAKLCFEAGIEIYQNHILILSSDKFGQTAAETFKAIGAASVEIRKPEEISELDFSKYDLVFVADYSTDKEILGKNVAGKLDELKNTAVVHLCGTVDSEFLINNGVYCYPEKPGYGFRMTYTLAHLGSKPIIDLHAAGLKVGECLVRGENSELVQLM